MARAGEAAAAGGQAAALGAWCVTDIGTLRRVIAALAADGGAPPRHEPLIGPAPELERRTRTWLLRVWPQASL